MESEIPVIPLEFITMVSPEGSSKLRELIESAILAESALLRETAQSILKQECRGTLKRITVQDDQILARVQVPGQEFVVYIGDVPLKYKGRVYATVSLDQ